MSTLSAFAILVGIQTVPETQAAVSFRTVAMSGDPAPDMSGGETFSVFEYYYNAFSQQGHNLYINDLGEVSFVAELAGAGVDSSNLNAYFLERSSSIELIVREGDQTPGVLVDTAFNMPNISGGCVYFNDSYQAVFEAELVGANVDATNDSSLWKYDGSSLQLIAHEGDTAPGLSTDEVYGQIDLYNAYRIQDAGNITYEAEIRSINGEVVGAGVWKESSGVSTLYIRTGDPVVGGNPGDTYTEFRLVEMNSLGQITIIGSYENSIGENVYFLGSDVSGTFEIIAAQGDPAPGTDAVFRLPTIQKIDETGHTIFFGYLEDSDIDDSNDFGIWSNSSGSVSLIAREGDAAPVSESGLPLDSLFYEIDAINAPFNDSGQLLFTATLTRPGKDGRAGAGIWLTSDDSVELIARGGQQAPGTEAGTTFSHVSFYRGYGPKPSLNNNGQVLFQVALLGPQVNSSNDLGYWATDTDGTLKLIIREGDVIDISNDPLIEDLRTVSIILSSNINDAGQMAFILRFTDGSSAIVVASMDNLPGDLNNDGFVGIDDLDIVLNNWNQSVDFGDESMGDYNGDGLIGIADLDAVLRHWNTSAPPNNGFTFAVIPEPGTVVMLLTGAGLMLRRRCC